jgi:hypothetical protein
LTYIKVYTFGNEKKDVHNIALCTPDDVGYVIAYLRQQTPRGKEISIGLTQSWLTIIMKMWGEEEKEEHVEEFKSNYVIRVKLCHSCKIMSFMSNHGESCQKEERFVAVAFVLKS